MSEKTGVFDISITTNDPNPGSQVHGIVFREPKEGDTFKRGDVSALHADGSGWFDPTNDAGELPHRERTSNDEDLGLTWQFPK